MHPVLPRVRLGLYAVVLLALITAAVVALVSLGTRSDSGASAAQRPAAPGATGPSVAGTKHPDVNKSGVHDRPQQASSPSPTSAAAPRHASRMSGAARSAHAATRPPKVYTVRPGDNLTAIAAWFHVRGYAPLYDWNKTVIGRNPDLIFPGQKIVVVPGGAVSVQTKR